MIELMVLHLMDLCGSENAIKRFVMNKRVVDFRITELEGSDSRWIEYKIRFATWNNVSEAPQCLRVGSYNNSLLNSESEYVFDVIDVIKTAFQFSLNRVSVNNTSTLETFLLKNITDLAVLYNSNKNIEYFPFFQTKYLLLYNANNIALPKDIFVLTFSGTLWLVCVILLIILALCLRIATTQYSRLRPKFEPWSGVEITLWAIAAACQQGLSKTPFGFSCCLIFLTGYLMAYLLYTGLAAAITSTLLRDNKLVLGLEDLSKNTRIVALKYSKQELESLENDFILTYVGNLDDLLEMMNEGKVVALLPEVVLYGDSKIRNFATSPVSRFKYIIPLRIAKENGWKQFLTYQFIRFHEVGILHNVFQRKLKKTSPILTESSGFFSAGLEHTKSAIYLFLIGVLTSMFILLCEFGIKCYTNNLFRKMYK